MIPFVNPARMFRPQRTLKELVRDAGLFANLQLCLDPGDRNSWPGFGQTIFDVSGGGRDFTLGTTTSSSIDDPIFSGFVGLEDDNSYFLSDGGDGFQKYTASDAFFNSLHQANFNFTIVSLDYFTNSYGAGLVTRAGAVNAGTSIGVSQYSSSSRPVLGVGNGSITVGTTVISSGSPLITNVLLMVGAGMKYNSPNSRDFVGYVNGTYEFQNFTSPSFTPSASAASTQPKFGLTSDGSLFMGNGRRFYGLMIFNKLLSQTEFDVLRASFKRRWLTL
ncbi:MAG: hypothetical protein EOQ94_20885 [Mesorhizobium sp.]|uniref:hypothetical protein n=1 Tax=Mesorhizobium sp. TaxID=1871066 RepID=UPI000FE51519|nr:hypothetical protein [Mesorhizobium sp.]RWI19452.1 MAG: hypothetical protein EOQ94_20885 [Mesorhizobium sp.]